MDGDTFDSLVREWSESGYHVSRADLLSTLLDTADIGCDGRRGAALTEEQAEMIGVSPGDGVDRFLACFVVLGQNIERREREKAEAEEEMDTNRTTGMLWARRTSTSEIAAALKASIAKHGVDAWSLTKLAAAIVVSIDELFGDFADATQRHAVDFAEAAIAACDALPLTEANRARLHAAICNRAPGMTEAAKAQGLREAPTGVGRLSAHRHSSFACIDDLCLRDRQPQADLNSNASHASRRGNEHVARGGRGDLKLLEGQPFRDLDSAT